MDLRALALVVLLALPARAQITLERFGGWNESESAAAISPAESPDLLNVESNLNATAILKRKGFTQQAILTVATAPVTGALSFKDSSGNNIDLVFHDRYGSKSTNNGAFTNWLTTAPAGITRWMGVAVGGKAYLVNDQRIAPLEYDGATQRPPASMPQGAVIELCGDRMAISDIAASPGRVAFSQSGVYTNFTTGTDSPDPWTDEFSTPGDRVTGLKCDRGRLYVFKTASITSCIMGDQYTTKCFPVSNAVGTLDPLSIVGAPDGIYFRSQDRAYWRLDDSGLTLLSQKISNFVKSQTQGSQQSNTQTTLTDWQAGSQYPGASWSTSTVAGSVVNSSTTVVPNTALNARTYYMTDVDTTAVVSTFVSNFDGGSLTSGLAWTQRTGNVSAVGNEMRFSSQPATGTQYQAWATSVVEHSTGSWAFTFKSTAACGGATALGYYFVSNTRDPINFQSGAITADAYRLLIQCTGNATTLSIDEFAQPATVTTLATVTESSCFCDGTTRNFRISRASNGYMSAYVNGVSTLTVYDTTLTTSTYNIVHGFGAAGGGGADLGTIRVDSVTIPAFYLGQVSVPYDTHYSTPIYGPYSVTLSSSINNATTFFAQVSANGASWDSLVSLTNGLRPGVAAKRYFRHSITPGPPFNGDAFTLSTAAVLLAATTGQYWTQCIQPGPNISSYGILSCDSTLTGTGSVVYYATSAYSCALLPDSVPLSWQSSVTNNATLSITVSSAVLIGYRSLLNSATDQAQVNACTLYWNVGTASQPQWGVYDPLKNAILWSASINNSTYNNRVLKYDLNLEQFYPFSLTATALNFSNSGVFFGSSSSGTWNRYGLVDSDNGGAINAYWRSKDFAGGPPFRETSWKSVSLIARNQVTGSMTGTWELSSGLTGNYTVSIGTTSTKDYVRSSYLLPLSSPANFINTQFGNNSTTPFEVLGVYFDGILQPFTPVNP